MEEHSLLVLIRIRRYNPHLCICVIVPSSFGGYLEWLPLRKHCRRTDRHITEQWVQHTCGKCRLPHLKNVQHNRLSVRPSVRPCARLAVSLSMFMMMMNFQLQSESMHFYHNQQPKSKSWHEGVILSNFDTLHKLSRSRSIATVHEIRMKLNQMANMFESTLGFY